MYNRIYWIIHSYISENKIILYKLDLIWISVNLIYAYYIFFVCNCSRLVYFCFRVLPYFFTVLLLLNIICVKCDYNVKLSY